MASSAIVVRDGRILMIRRRNPPSLDMFAFPGGRAEPGETPEVTALRELFEETGVTGRDPALFATYDLHSENPKRHFHLTVFRVEPVGDAEAVAADDAADAGWYLPSEIRLMNVPSSVLECVERMEADLQSFNSEPG